MEFQSTVSLEMCNKAPKIGLRTVSVAVSADQISQSNQTSENVGSQKKNGPTADQNLTRTDELNDAVGVFVHAFFFFFFFKLDNVETL